MKLQSIYHQQAHWFINKKAKVPMDKMKPKLYTPENSPRAHACCTAQEQITHASPTLSTTAETKTQKDGYRIGASQSPTWFLWMF